MEDSISSHEGGLIEDEIRHLLEIPEIPPARLVKALRIWEETEGKRFGETIEGLIDDFGQEIDDREKRVGAIGDEELRLSKTGTIGTMRRNLARLMEEINLDHDS